MNQLSDDALNLLAFYLAVMYCDVSPTTQEFSENRAV